ncbi:hypothetical protein [Shewanella sp. M-Br]|nr:hypothetical protein SMBr_28570 [Shewanella sp. M-Br]
MKSPKIPDDEQVRLSQLRALVILDISPEERFEELSGFCKFLLNYG